MKLPLARFRLKSEIMTSLLIRPAPRRDCGLFRPQEKQEPHFEVKTYPFTEGFISVPDNEVRERSVSIKRSMPLQKGRGPGMGKRNG